MNTGSPTIRRTILVTTLLILLLGMGCEGFKRAFTTRQIPDVAATAHAVIAAVGGDRPSYISPDNWLLERQIYRDRDGLPLWADPTAPRPRARALVEALCSADSEAVSLPTRELSGLAAALQAAYETDTVSAGSLAETDLRLTDLFLRYGRVIAAGRVPPSSVDTSWYLRSRRMAVNAALAAALRKRDFAGMVAVLQPSQPDYTGLLEALGRYQRIAASGGWAAIPPGPPLRRGDRGKRVTALRARLTAVGDLAGDTTQAVYDSTTALAVARFQTRYGLKPTGVADRPTLEAMDVPATRRARQLAVNLERIRWLPGSLGRRYILINLSESRLTAHDSAGSDLELRAEAGAAVRPVLPVFADSLSRVLFHPDWVVPASYARREILPALRRDPGFAARHRYQLLDARTGAVVNPRRVDWRHVDSASFHYRVRQLPGPGNPLGSVRFSFLDRADVYLHDWPADQRASAEEPRGAIRIDHPVRLADWVLGPDTSWTDARVQSILRAPADSAVTVVLEPKVPTYVVYLTAFMQNGVVNFRPDVYGLDSAVAAQLAPLLPNSAQRAVCVQLEKLLKG